jgi:ADP-ribose pyrophosphatase
VRREAREEADCEVEDIVFGAHYLASPGASSESVYVFGARVDSSKAGGIHGLTEEHENIRVLVVPVADVFAWVDSGKINNAMTIVSLQWFRVQYPTLRTRWRKTPR